MMDYFDNLYNIEGTKHIKNITTLVKEINRDFKHKIRPHRVKETLKRMKNNKVIGLEGILIKVWKCSGEFGIVMLMDIFNKI